MENQNTHSSAVRASSLLFDYDEHIDYFSILFPDLIRRQSAVSVKHISEFEPRHSYEAPRLSDSLLPSTTGDLLPKPHSRNTSLYEDHHTIHDVPAEPGSVLHGQLGSVHSATETNVRVESEPESGVVHHAKTERNPKGAGRPKGQKSRKGRKHHLQPHWFAMLRKLRRQGSNARYNPMSDQGTKKDWETARRAYNRERRTGVKLEQGEGMHSDVPVSQPAPQLAACNVLAPNHDPRRRDSQYTENVTTTSFSQQRIVVHPYRVNKEIKRSRSV